MRSRGDYFSKDMRLWGDAAGANLAAITTPFRRAQGRISLSSMLGVVPVGGVVELAEEVYYLPCSLTVPSDDALLVGKGLKTVVKVMGTYTLTWSGDRGAIRNVYFQYGAGARVPRVGGGYFLEVSGDRFELDRTWFKDFSNAVHVQAGADNARLLHSRAEDQLGAGFLGEGTDCLMFDLEATRGAVASEISSNGARGWVGACRCIGGGILVAGAGSVDAGNFV